jgi:hypothetical protein
MQTAFLMFMAGLSPADLAGRTYHVASCATITNLATWHQVLLLLLLTVVLLALCLN